MHMAAPNKPQLPATMVADHSSTALPAHPTRNPPNAPAGTEANKITKEIYLHVSRPWWWWWHRCVGGNRLSTIRLQLGISTHGTAVCARNLIGELRFLGSLPWSPCCCTHRRLNVAVRESNERNWGAEPRDRTTDQAQHVGVDVNTQSRRSCCQLDCLLSGAIIQLREYYEFLLQPLFQLSILLFQGLHTVSLAVVAPLGGLSIVCTDCRRLFKPVLCHVKCEWKVSPAFLRWRRSSSDSPSYLRGRPRLRFYGKGSAGQSRTRLGPVRISKHCLSSTRTCNGTADPGGHTA
eukprot:SAG31_NODE_3495_length_4199_cov_2.274878_1_plen_292_part_00